MDFPVTEFQNFLWAVVFLILLIFFVKLFEQAWLFWRQSLFKKSITWTTFEILVPRQVEKTPKAMEQFFYSIYAMRNVAGDLVEKYIDGEVPLWWSFEIVSYGGQLHFFMRSPKKHAGMVKAALYAQYPTAEIIETEDYVKDIPGKTMDFYKKKYDLFGTEFVLGKEDVYPITTYEQFEITKDELAVDPMSALLEIVASIHKEENVYFQILARPADPVACTEAGRKFVDKLVGRKPKKKKKNGINAGEFLANLTKAPVSHPEWKEKPREEEEKIERDILAKLTPGEQTVVKAIDHNTAKPPFDVIIRVLYTAPVSVYNTNFARRGLRSGLNQYASQYSNFFLNNLGVETRTKWISFPYIYPKRRAEARKQRFLYNFRNRIMPQELEFGKLYTSHPLDLNTKSRSIVLSAAELATIYHVPGELILSSPYLKRVESKRLGPPAGLPIFKEDE
jgi:hypothetical protein